MTVNNVHPATGREGKEGE